MSPVPRWIAASTTSCLVSLLTAHAFAAAPTRGAVPSWVAPTTAAPLRSEAVGQGVVWTLVDEQVRAGAARYLHRTMVVTSSTGVAETSEVSISFDPAYQRLVFHRIEIRRGETTRSVLDLSKIRTFSEERESDARIYDGSMTALVVLPDVRVGDIVDYEYTIEGENPVFGGRIADSFRLAYSVPVEALRYRLLVPAGRQLAFANDGLDVAPERRTVGTEQEFLWHREQVAAVENDRETPDWYAIHPVVRYSDAGSWSEVARWASDLFDRSPPPAAVVAEARRFRESSSDPLEQGLAAVRFVQDEVRYLGIEMGEGSHRPRPTSVVLAQRFGDCKDKALLLVTLLRLLGFSADVALVNTFRGSKLDAMPPSVHAFNHAIVRVVVAGRTRFVDPTLRNQGGTLKTMVGSEHGFALVVRPDTGTLEPMPAAPPGEVPFSTRETYTVEDGGPAAGLEVLSTYRDDDANGMRDTVAARPRAELAKAALNYYAEDEPSIRSAGEIGISDDRRDNVLTVRESYRIPDYVRDDRACFRASAFDSFLKAPATRLRSMPLAIPHPYARRHEVSLVWGLAGSPPELVERETAAFRFRRASMPTSGGVRVGFDLRSEADAVAPDAVATHLRDLETVRASLPVCVPRGERANPPAGVPLAALPPPGRGPLGGDRWTAVLVAAGALVLGVFVLVKRLRRKRSSDWTGGRDAPGTTPSVAIPVLSRESAERHLRAAKCSCGGTGADEIDWGGLRLEGRRITRGTIACECGGPIKRFYVVDGGVEVERSHE
jgi:transglutaminase-like putative cysteine protease